MRQLNIQESVQAARLYLVLKTTFIGRFSREKCLFPPNAFARAIKEGDKTRDVSDASLRLSVFISVCPAPLSTRHDCGILGAGIFASGEGVKRA